MKKVTKSVLFLTVLMLSMSENVWADGFTRWAVPTQIATTGDGGIIIDGTFGNPDGCLVPDKIIVKSNTNQLKFVEATVLTALISRRAIRFYVTDCDSSYDGLQVNRAYESRNVMIQSP